MEVKLFKWGERAVFDRAVQIHQLQIVADAFVNANAGRFDEDYVDGVEWYRQVSAGVDL